MESSETKKEYTEKEYWDEKYLQEVLEEDYDEVFD